MPISSGDFFGRGQELTQMQKILNVENDDQKIIVLWGLGGSGKTRLVLEYINRHQKECSVILWINAANLETAEESYSQCAQQLAAEGMLASLPLEAKSGIKLVHKWLVPRREGSWLLIIDSIDDLEAFDCRRLIPQCKHGTVIVTSTHFRATECLGSTGLEVGGLDEKAGCEMLLSRHKSRSNFHQSLRAQLTCV